MKFLKSHFNFRRSERQKKIWAYEKLIDSCTRERFSYRNWKWIVAAIFPIYPTCMDLCVPVILINFLSSIIFQHPLPFPHTFGNIQLKVAQCRKAWNGNGKKVIKKAFFIKFPSIFFRFFPLFRFAYSCFRFHSQRFIFLHD